MTKTAGKKECEWNSCTREGRYRIQTTANQSDIHWFCQVHARAFDLSVVNQGPFIGSAGPSWTNNEPTNSQSSTNGFGGPTPGINSNIRMRHISGNKTFSYTRADLQNLKTLGLETGASSEEIKKAYKRLVKHCHPDQNPDLENGEYIFNTITEAYNALKNKDFK